jgi:sterol desaturase/sphingolipid hydroxylase (fatty acid hydroxylase superfamily)
VKNWRERIDRNNETYPSANIIWIWVAFYFVTSLFVHVILIYAQLLFGIASPLDRASSLLIPAFLSVLFSLVYLFFKDYDLDGFLRCKSLKISAIGNIKEMFIDMYANLNKYHLAIVATLIVMCLFLAIAVASAVGIYINNILGIELSVVGFVMVLLLVARYLLCLIKAKKYLMIKSAFRNKN